jgi:biotin synthase
MTLEQIRDIYFLPLIELLGRAVEVHRKHHNPRKIQTSSLLSIKTGGCPEDCAYCPQSAKYHTEVKVHKLMDKEEVVEFAKKARASGAGRVCLGAAWREVRNNRDFDKVVDMVKEISSLGMEVCATLGMLTEEQAKRLKEAGLYAYNHNLDTSESFYGKIITTRTYSDRINTLNNARKAGLTLCSGGIIGMGESEEDRIGMLHSLSLLQPPPESIPINALVPVDGTPLENQSPVPVWDLVRMIATARIVFPASMIRLSAGRTSLSREAQALCFLAGANSVFIGDKLLTTPNPQENEDMELFRILGIQPLEPYEHEKKNCKPEVSV